MFEEARFLKFFSENATGRNRKLLWCHLFQKEYTLWPAYDLLKREFYEKDKDGKRLLNSKQIGRIDLIFRYRGYFYCGEIKCQPFANNDFWDSLKIIGYTLYFNWQNNLSKIPPHHPAVFIPDKSIRLEHMIVANKLKLLVMGIIKDGEGYKLIDRSKNKVPKN